MKTIILYKPKFMAQAIIDSPFELTPKFFLAILAGVILAIVFQLVLTALSVAVGITAVGNLKQKFVDSQNPDPDDNEVRDEYSFDQDYSSGTPLGVKITSAFGIWSVITTSLALFAATAIALNLSVISTTETSITMALVIWASFFLLMFYLESRIVSTTVGGLINTATSGLRSSIKGVKEFVTPSKEKKVQKVVDHSLDSIKKEIENTFDADKLQGSLEAFASKVNEKIPNYETIKSDMETIAKKGRSKNSTGKWMAIQQVLTNAIDKNKDDNSAESRSKTEQAKYLLKQIHNAYDNNAGTKENIVNIASTLSSKDRQEIDSKVDYLLNQFSTSGSNDFEDGSIMENLKSFLNDPKNALHNLTSDSGSSKLNRESIINALDKNTNIDKAKLQSYADSFDKVIINTQNKLDTDNEEGLFRKLEGSIKSYFDSMEREELAYSELKKDLKLIIDSPNDSYTVVKERLAKMDRDSLKAILSSVPYLKKDHIDKIETYLHEAKSKTRDKLSSIETKAKQRYEMAKRKAVIKAEQARLTAASAAWWLVITAVISGLASVGGVFLS